MSRPVIETSKLDLKLLGECIEFDLTIEANVNPSFNGSDAEPAQYTNSEEIRVGFYVSEFDIIQNRNGSVFVDLTSYLSQKQLERADDIVSDIADNMPRYNDEL